MIYENVRYLCNYWQCNVGNVIIGVSSKQDVYEKEITEEEVYGSGDHVDKVLYYSEKRRNNSKKKHRRSTDGSKDITPICKPHKSLCPTVGGDEVDIS